MGQRADWWDTRACAALIVLLSTVPMLWPSIPPLGDLPGHIGRYHLMAVLGDGGPLDRYYALDRAVIGNLGVDLVALALAPITGLEPATKLVVIAIPALTVTGMIALSHAVHGRLVAPVLLALPLAYAFPLQMGFVNYALAAALALLGLALWIRLAGRWRLRLALMLPIAGLVWLSHSFGWVLLGLTCGGAEIAIHRARGDGWPRAVILAGLSCLPLAWPALLMVGSDAPLTGVTGDWFAWRAKAQWIVSALRERWKWWDVAAVAILICATYGLWRAKTVRVSPVLAIPALLCAAGFILLPRLLQGGAYVDARVVPHALILALIACAPEARPARRVALAGAIFAGLRLAATTAAFVLFARAQDRDLAALDAIPRGAAVLVLVNEPCGSDWSGQRITHIDGLAVARRDAFVNGLWALSGQQLVRPILAGAAPYDRDPSHLVYPDGCAFQATDYDRATAGFDRGVFDHVWTVGFPPARNRAGDLSPIWTDGRSTVYRVNR